MNVTIVNTGAPELHRLAEYLCDSGDLGAYVRPFAGKSTPFSRFLRAIPVLGEKYEATFGRRRLRNDELLNHIVEAGVIADFTSAIVKRAAPAPRLEFWLHELLRAAIQKKSVSHVAKSTHVIANVGCALRAFQAVPASVLKILHYPSAHPRFFERTWVNERRNRPEFASTSPNFGQLSERILLEYDEEIRLADRIIVGSRFVAESFVAQGVSAEKIRTVPYGVDHQIFYPRQTEKREFNVLFVGRLEQKKGLQYLLQAYEVFRQTGTRLTLIGQIVGSSRPLAQYAHLYDHEPQLTRERLAQTMREASVLVLPSLIEGLPLSVMEAMASGLPVIVTACGADDLVRDGRDGIIVPMQDADAIVDALKMLFENPDMAKNMGQEAVGRIARFTWQSFAEKYRDAASINAS